MSSQSWPLRDCSFDWLLGMSWVEAEYVNFRDIFPSDAQLG